MREPLGVQWHSLLLFHRVSLRNYFLLDARQTWKKDYHELFAAELRRFYCLRNFWIEYAGQGDRLLLHGVVSS